MRREAVGFLAHSHTNAYIWDRIRQPPASPGAFFRDSGRQMDRQLVLSDGTRPRRGEHDMRFIEWWSEQSMFNRLGMAFVAAVVILVLLGLSF